MTQLNITIPDDLKARLKIRAIERNIGISELCSQIFDDYFGDSDIDDDYLDLFEEGL